MPIYEYQCLACGSTLESYRKIEERNDHPDCKCGKRMSLQLSLPANSYISGYPYNDPILGQTVNDPAHRKRLLKENNLVERG